MVAVFCTRTAPGLPSSTVSEIVNPVSSNTLVVGFGNCINDST